MIHPLHTLPAEVTLEADLCVIGAGAAGLTLASEFMHSPWKVLLLESGDVRRTTTGDDMNVAEVVGLPHRGASEGRARVLGGATTAWGGQLLPLRDSETAQRDWVPASGWPFAAATLDPYYRHAERLLGMNGPPYDHSTWSHISVDAPAFDDAVLVTRFSQWAPLTRRNFAVLQGAALRRSHNIDVLLGATVTGFLTHADRTAIRELRVHASGDRIYRVKARQYVLCTGGIETPRLLLHAGLANRSGMLGHYFQDHLSWVAAEISPASRARVRHHFEPRYRGRAMYTAKIEPSDQSQRDHTLLNCMAHVKFDIPEALGLLEAKQMMRAVQRGQLPVPSLRALLAMTRGGFELSRMVFSRLAHNRRSAPSRGAMYLLIDVEQAPNPRSRITLSSECDAAGVPRARIDWCLSGQEWQTMERFRALMVTQWQRAGLGDLRLADAPDFTRADEGLGSARDIYHHMGTARMSAHPGDGVVNPDLRCHDLHNLYIASSAVFPTGGIANPTFTILALTIRLADHLKQRLMTV